MRYIKIDKGPNRAQRRKSRHDTTVSVTGSKDAQHTG